MNCPPDFSGAGIASLLLNISILQRLEAKGVLSLEEIADVVDRASLAAEEADPNAPERQSVHEILAGVLSTVQGRMTPPKQS